MSHCPSVWKWKEYLISRRIFGKKKKGWINVDIFMFQSATLPHIRKTASTSATPTLSGDIEKTYVLVQKLVLGWLFQSFYFFKCLFSQNSLGVFRDQQFEENGETQKGERYKAFLNSRDHFGKRGGQQRRGKPRLKMNWYFWQEFREWKDLFTVSYSDTRQLQHNVCQKALSSNWKLE